MGRRWIIKWQRWTRKGSPLYWALPLSVLVLLVAAFLIVEWRLRNAIIAIAEVETKAKVIDIINQTVSKQVGKYNNMDQLIQLRTDSQGRVVLLQPNTIQISRLAAETTLDVQNELNKLQHTPVQIPIGKVSGMALLAHLGPRIKIEIWPIGNVNIAPSEFFEEAGINQTKHMLSLIIDVKMRMVVPIVSSDIEVKTTVPVTTTVISGQVPQVYMKGDASKIPLDPSRFITGN